MGSLQFPNMGMGLRLAAFGRRSSAMIKDRIGLHSVLLPINHKNYNFREKKNNQVMKEREICIKILSKEK